MFYIIKIFDISLFVTKNIFGLDLCGIGIYVFGIHNLKTAWHSKVIMQSTNNLPIDYNIYYSLSNYLSILFFRLHPFMPLNLSIIKLIRSLFYLHLNIDRRFYDAF